MPLDRTILSAASILAGASWKDAEPIRLTNYGVSSVVCTDDVSASDVRLILTKALR
jgi:hypothetical protein